MFSCVMICVLLIFSTGITVVSAAEKKSGMLTITCRTDEIVLADMEWNVYKVADITSNKKYDLVGRYKNYPVNVNGLSTSKMQAAAETLEAYTKVDKIKHNQHGKTNNKGKVVFENLDFGLYLISGKPVTVDDMFYIPAPSLVVLDKSSDGNTVWGYDVTSMPKLKVLPTSMRVYDHSCSVKKVWSGDNEKTRPESITAVLHKDGEEFLTVELNKDNNWEHTWENLSTSYDWTVIEKNVPENYLVTYTKTEIESENEYESDIMHVINNTYYEEETEVPTSPSTDIQMSTQTNAQTSTNTQTFLTSTNVSTVTSGEKLPQTGQLWWPVPVLSASGLIVLGTGWKINSDKRKDNES